MTVSDVMDQILLRLDHGKEESTGFSKDLSIVDGSESN